MASKSGRMTFAGFYTPAQAMKILGIPRPALDTFIRNKQLNAMTPPGRKQIVIDKHDVDNMAREMQAFIAYSATSPARYVKGTVADMEECAALVKNIFDVRPNAERRGSWIAKNPDVCYLVKVSDKIVGLAFLLPLTMEKIQEIWSLEHSPPLYADDIQPYAPGKPVNLYVLSMGVQPSSVANKRLWGSRLVAGLMRTIVEMGSKGIEIDAIWARSEYPDGIELMRHIGFTEIPSTNQQRNFVIRVAESGIPQVLEYKAALALHQGKEPPHIPKPQKYPAKTYCPECGDLDSAILTFERIGKSHKYRCTNCGYEAER